MSEAKCLEAAGIQTFVFLVVRQVIFSFLSRLNTFEVTLTCLNSSLNGMGYIRGPASDFDRWADDFGNPGWSYEEVLPYFKKAECFHDPALPSDHPRGPKTNRVHDPETETFEPEYHGTEGPWNLTYQYLNGASRGFMRANEAEGVPRNYDVNG